MNNDEIYIEIKCDARGKYDYSVQFCNQCHKKYCRSAVCSNSIVNIQKKLICKGGCTPPAPTPA